VTSTLDGLPPLKDVIASFGLAARRSLGQHFLLDPRITERIAAAAGDLNGKTVLEIGPGPGGLTRALLAAGTNPLIAIERDQRCVEALQDVITASQGHLNLVSDDALAVDEAMLIPAYGGRVPCLIVANLPYNIATVLILKWLAQPHLFADIVVMVQKEVAQRLAAPVRSDSYGRLSVMAQWRAEISMLFDLAPGAFAPPPKVTSTVVRITPRKEPATPADPKAMETVVRAAFGQRRKMLRSALKSLDKNSIELLEKAGIDQTARAEELDIAAFGRLARAYAERN
jgi:16S rRNA (adenine1518-N6/adenine1519-N6)-dimethyltransferase